MFIDGYDAYTNYGVYVVEGGYDELIAFPPLKSVDTNDWHEIDGIEADLENPVLDTKEVSIKLFVTDNVIKYPSMISYLSDESYHIFDVRYIGRVYKLRLVSFPSAKSIRNFSDITLKFADDFPLDKYEYLAPLSGITLSKNYLLDGKPFTDYNVNVLIESDEEINKMPAVKTNMVRNIKIISGAIYDDKNVKYKSRDVTLSCLMRAKTLDTLWRNWDALLYDLVRPEERMLETQTSEFPFYYKSCKVTKFYRNKNLIWLQFQLTIHFTHDFLDFDLLLASEDNILMCTEDEEYFIDMRPDRQ